MIAKACHIDNIQHLMDEYVQGLSSPIDSFLEDHILTSMFYSFQDSENVIGYYAIHTDQLLTQFYIRRSHLKHSQIAFGDVLERHTVKSLFVPTCDELLLSLALDREFAINKQAYFFQDSQVEIGNADRMGNEVFRQATIEDIGQIQQICGDFLDHYERRITSGEIFTYSRGTELLGIGVMERSKLFEAVGSIGMFTNEAYRLQGTGRAIIVNLRKWCAGRGITPISGCWYYNEASKRTLESAGMVTKTRLLNIEVKRP
jgi:hypothetical protein